MKMLPYAGLTLVLARSVSIVAVWAEDAGKLEPYVVSSFGNAQKIEANLFRLSINPKP